MEEEVIDEGTLDPRPWSPYPRADRDRPGRRRSGPLAQRHRPSSSRRSARPESHRAVARRRRVKTPRPTPTHPFETHASVPHTAVKCNLCMPEVSIVRGFILRFEGFGSYGGITPRPTRVRLRQEHVRLFFFS